MKNIIIFIIILFILSINCGGSGGEIIPFQNFLDLLYKHYIKEDLYNYIKNVSNYFGLDYHIVFAVMITESGGREKIVSKAGAIGLFQIMPILAIDYGYSREDLFNPYINAFIGIKHLSKLLNKYKDLETVFIVYLCGEKNFNRNPEKFYLVSQNYIRKIKNLCFIKFVKEDI